MTYMLWLHVGVFVLRESARVLNLLSQKFFLIAYLDIIFFPFLKKITISPSVWKCTLPHLVLVNWWREAFKGHASNNLPSPGKKILQNTEGFFLIVLVCLASLSPSSAVSVFLYFS